MEKVFNSYNIAKNSKIRKSWRSFRNHNQSYTSGFDVCPNLRSFNVSGYRHYLLLDKPGRKIAVGEIYQEYDISGEIASKLQEVGVEVIHSRDTYVQ